MSDARPTLFLTNDDGWDAPGLYALWQAAQALGNCLVAAPEFAHSGCGHRVTTHGPIDINRIDSDRISIGGTPADCVRLGIHHLAPNPSWVLAGINAGGNLGVDIHHSGTVAAVRESVIHGVPGIALSHFIARGRALDWPRTTRWAEAILRQLMGMPWEPGTFWNVNFPHLEPDAPDPEVVFCPVDPSPLPIDYRLESNQATYSGNYQARPRIAGGDVETCFGGRIAVSLVRL